VPMEVPFAKNSTSDIAPSVSATVALMVTDEPDLNDDPEEGRSDGYRWRCVKIGLVSLYKIFKNDIKFQSERFVIS
jgi:hypothetical protein